MTSEDARPLLELRSVSCGYAGGLVVRDVTIRIGAGEAVAILGRNGMGKTTLLRMAMGLLATRAGRVVVDGIDVTQWPAHRRARLGLTWVPQDRAVFPGLTVAEHLALAGPHVRAEERARIAGGLFPVLLHRLRQDAESLSGGEQKMLGIAQAVISKPRLLILDEPTEGVDPLVRNQLRAVLRSLVSQCAVLLVEQNLDTALAVAGRAYVLERGEVADEGSLRHLHAAGILDRRLSL